MPKTGYITAPVSPIVEEMFDEFVKTKGVTKTAALTDMVELYMLATDEKLYLDIKKRHLNVGQVKEMIAGRDIEEDEENVAETFIFMKLGTSTNSKGDPYDGDDTMEVYIKDAKQRGYTWFSTESLFFGMSKRSQDYFRKLIREGRKVKMLFAVSGVNDIKYSATVEEVESSPTPQPPPDPNGYPKEFWTPGARIWIKLRDLMPDRSISARDLIVKSTGSVLKDVIANSQYHFGYVTRR